MSGLAELLKTEFSNPLNAVAQLVGFLPMILAFFVFIFDDRRKIIGFKTVTDLLWALHFLLLGEMSGCVINCINTIRNIIFFRRRSNHIALPVIFCVITAAATLLKWEGMKSLLPLFGSCLAIVGLWCSDPKSIRKYNFFGVGLWFVYSIITCSISSIICNAVSLLSIVIAEIKNRA